MAIVRLLDGEGRDWIGKDLAVPDPPPHDIVMAVSDRLTLKESDDPTLLPTINKVRFVKERQRGDGVWIYRRDTPLWR